jgi:uncharacterized protein
MILEPFIYQQNPQWLTNRYPKPEKDWFYRSVYKNILSLLNKRSIIALTGLRRVGKSTLLNQLKYYLEENDIETKNILSVSFEKSQVKSDPETLRNVLNWYFEVFLKTTPKFLTNKIYIFFDEIQYIPNWQDIIKTYYDLSPNIKFFLSGSSSLFIKKKATESLAGRLIEIKIPVLSFIEFLNLKKSIYKNIRQTFQSHPALMDSLLNEYLTIGQFPELVKEQYNQSQAKLYLTSVEEKIVEQDIPKIFPVERIDILNLIFNQIKSNHSDLFEFKNITNDLGINLKTTIKYFGFLEKSYLISLCFNKTKRTLKSSRSAKKVYLSSTNFSLNTISKKVENYIYNILSLSYPIWFYRKNNFEVDFIIKINNLFIPIEVKYQDKIENKDYLNLITLSKKLKSNVGYLISKSTISSKEINGVKIKTIPACLTEQESFEVNEDLKNPPTIAQGVFRV